MKAIASFLPSFTKVTLKNNCPHEVIEPITQEVIKAGDSLVIAISNPLEKSILCRYVAMMNAMSNDCLFIQEM